MLRCDGRVLEDIGLGDRDGSPKLFLTVIDTSKNGTDSQYLEGAAHGERFLHPVSNHATAFSFEQSHSDSAAALHFKLR